MWYLLTSGQVVPVKLQQYIMPDYLLCLQVAVLGVSFFMKPLLTSNVLKDTTEVYIARYKNHYLQFASVSFCRVINYRWLSLTNLLHCLVTCLLQHQS